MVELTASPSAKTRAVSSRMALPRRHAVVALLAAAGYYFTAKIGFAFALQPGSISTLWLPNSILLAALLLLPPRAWWLVLLATAPAHFAAELQSGVPTTMVLSWLLSNSVQAVLAAVGIQHFVSGRLRFDRFKDLTIFVLFGAFLAPFLASFLDIALVKLNGLGTSSYWEIWRIRFLSNVLASLTLVPVLVTLTSGGLTVLRRASWRRYVEAAILVGGLLLVAVLVFNSRQEFANRTPTLLSWPLPFLLWAAVRFGPGGASTSLLLVMLVVISGATHGQGPFVASSSAENALALQVFLICIALPLLSLAAVTQERRRAEEAARQNEERLTLALSAAQMGTWDWHLADNRLIWSDNSRRIFGLPADEPDTTVNSFLASIDPADRTAIEAAVRRALKEGSPYEVEFRLLTDDTTRWVLGKGKVFYDDAHHPTRMIGVNIDITEQRQAEQALRESNEKLLQSNRQIHALVARLLSAQEAERRHISLQLHDDLSQNIAALGMTISQLKRKLPASREEIAAELTRLGQHTNDLTRQIRRLSHQLHPAALEHLGLVAALKAHASEFMQEEEIDVRFVAEVRRDKIPFAISVCLYRVALEALRNVSRHSGAGSVTLFLAEDEEALTLEVTDTGKGFDVEQARRGGGLGLIYAEERVKMLQGRFEVRSEAASGTTLVARIPLPRQT